MNLKDTALYLATGGYVRQTSWGPDTYAYLDNGELTDEAGLIVELSFDMAILDADWEYVLPADVARIQALNNNTNRVVGQSVFGGTLPMGRKVSGPIGACDCGKEKHGFSHHIGGCPAEGK